MNNNYQIYLNSPEWKALRQQVISRANGICERCHNRPISHIHHLTYVRFGNEYLEDLEGLCIPCHEYYHPKQVAKQKALDGIQKELDGLTPEGRQERALRAIAKETRKFNQPF